jgi:glycerol uptake facilitator-like aquaporin
MLSGVMLALGYWLLIALSYNISGSHYNPAITAACMFRKNVGRFPRWLGVAYIACQAIGAFAGALLSFMWTRNGGSLAIEDSKHVFQAMGIEACGTFFFVSIFLINTEFNSRFFHEPGLRFLAISAAYV